MKRIQSIIQYNLVYPFKDNGILHGIINIISIILDILYNLFFLRRKRIRASFTSNIKGFNYMQVGSVRFGKYCRIEMIPRYNGYTFNPKLKIGNRVCMNDMVHIGCANYIEIGDDCLFASRIYISDHNHGIYKEDNSSLPLESVAARTLDNNKSVIIGKNVWLGEGVAVLPGSKIGDNSIIGANAVVCGVIPPNSIAVGIPAKVIKKFDSSVNEWINC